MHTVRCAFISYTRTILTDTNDFNYKRDDNRKIKKKIAREIVTVVYERYEAALENLL